MITPPPSALIEQVLSQQELQALIGIVQNLPNHIEHEVTIPVGKMNRGTAHPHRFVLRNTGDAAEIYFLDPEDHVGVRPLALKPKPSLHYVQDILRPRVVNICAIHIPYEHSGTPTIISLRYHSKFLQETFGEIDRLDFQLGVAKDALAHHGLPEILRNIPQEIITRIVIEPESAIVQDRHSTRAEAETFLRTGAGSPILEARLLASRQVFRRILRAAQEQPPRILTS